MRRYYDIKVKSTNNKGTFNYWADSFSIDEYGILRVRSEEAGGCVVQIEPTEEIEIKSVDVKEIWDDLED